MPHQKIIGIKHDEQNRKTFDHQKESQFETKVNRQLLQQLHYER